MTDEQSPDHLSVSGWGAGMRRKDPIDGDRLKTAIRLVRDEGLLTEGDMDYPWCDSACDYLADAIERVYDKLKTRVG